jgi:FAD binding domain
VVVSQSQGVDECYDYSLEFFAFIRHNLFCLSAKPLNFSLSNKSGHIDIVIAASTMPETTSHIDLLIIGAGPAGLMAATWASKYDISTRIIDKARDRVQVGHADCLQPRTLEIFDSFGMADRLWKESYHEIELCSWVNHTLKLRVEQLLI